MREVDHRRRRGPRRTEKAGSEPRSSDGSAGAGTTWQATVAAVCVSQCTLKFGFGFATPFIPLFLHQELHVHTAASLAFWSGVVAGATGLGSVVTAPLWGGAADRLGRKRMLIRAMGAGAVVMALTSIVQTPLQFAGVRLLLGATGGTTPASSALIAAETPAPRVGRALGILTSAMAVGQTFGPIGGSFLALQVGLRKAFALGGALVAMPILPLAAIVRETRKPTSSVRMSFRSVIRNLTPTHRNAIAAVLGAQCLTQFAFVGTQQLTVVKIVDLGSGGATVRTGLAFLILGGCVSVSGAAFSTFLTQRFRLHSLSVLSPLLMAACIAVMAEASTLPLVFCAAAGVGLSYGILNPSLYTMIGLEAPSARPGMFFGLNAAAVAVGLTLGPLVGGTVASFGGIGSGLLTATGALVVAAAVLSRASREPVLAEG